MGEDYLKYVNLMSKVKVSLTQPASGTPGTSTGRAVSLCTSRAQVSWHSAECHRYFHENR